MIPQIPYSSIGLGIALIFIGLAFYEAEATGRIVILSAFALSFILPALFSSYVLSVVCRIGRLVLGIICFVYWKYKVAGP
ncbi:MAG: hypothetical protein MUQ00_05565 [Candidatus Aminicenantes bacterium]|nr:hypothetical protein [Candidatus Aminicenantes bacterium]